MKSFRFLGVSIVACLLLVANAHAQTLTDPTSCLKSLGVAEGQMPTIEQLQKCAPQAPSGTLTAPSSISAPQPTSSQYASCPNLTRTLGKGSRGTDVTSLQSFLIQKGYLASDSATGYFGTLTENAVKQFQCAQSIVCSGTPASTGYGLVGAKTRAAIQRSCSGTTTTTTTNTTSNSSQSLIDQLNAQIKQLQERLAALSGSGSQTTQPTQSTQTTTQTTQTTQITTNASCSFNNQTVAHGASVTAYQSSSVASGQTCQSQTRACSNGTLSGTYTAVVCSVSAAAAQLSSAVVVSQLPASSVGSFALYARNSPHYVQAGTISYVALNISNTFYIYRRVGSGNWSIWQQLGHDYHRAPSLFVSNDNRLHVLSESAAGVIGHRVYTNANTESPQGPFSVDASAWGSGNYYIGGAYNVSDGKLYLCATYNLYDGNEYSKCGAYTTAWNVIQFQSYTNHVYLYPNMHPDLGGGFWLDMGAYPLARSGAAYASHVRTLNAIWRVNSSLGIISGGAAYGSTALGKTYFANDVAAVPGGGVATFPVTSTYHLDGRSPSDSNVYSLLSSESFSKQYATGLTGSAYTAQTVGGKTYLVGAGRIASSSDGKTWTTSSYEIPGFPANEYTYGVAQTLQAKGGGTQSSDLRFIQELTNKSDLRHTIVEVRMPF